jgi:ketosteroid isomerase-like protein
MSDRETALFANAAFYAAFAARDVAAMERLWGDGDVICVHPGWPPVMGRDAVLASWRNILTGGGAPDISCRQATAVLHGTVAIVICMEMIAVDGRIQQALSATNMFVKPAGAKEWRMIHHQAGQANVDPRKIEEDQNPPAN